MINKVKVTNLADAESYAYGPNNDFDVWISTVDSVDKRKMNRMKELLAKKGVKHFYQLFTDWSDEDGMKWAQLEADSPQLRHIQNIITFIKPFVEDDKVHNVGINCFAGISRSTALAIVVLVMSGKTVQEAIDYVLKVRFEAWPNVRVTRLASEILGIDISTPVIQWKKDILSNLDDGELFLPSGYSK
jgi:predicted protein tyrosine phosphatase